MAVGVCATDGRPVLGLEARQPAYRTLIVDNEPDNSKVLERLMRLAGFQVRVADDGKQESKSSNIASLPDLYGYARAADGRFGGNPADSRIEGET